MFNFKIAMFLTYIIYNTPFAFSLNEFTSEEESTCFQLLSNFAEANAKFTNCSIIFAQPVTFCESCVQHYADIITSYSNLSAESAGIRCLDKFTNLDRLQIVTTIYRNNVNLWDRAKCNECFVEVDGVPSMKISNETARFKLLYNSLQICLNQTDLEIKQLCFNCLDNYLSLNSFYWSVSNKNEKIGVCMDIVDLMNGTWTKWNKHCCQYRRHNESIFIATTALVSILPILFYILVKIFGNKSTRKLVEANRFVTSVTRSETENR